MTRLCIVDRAHYDHVEHHKTKAWIETVKLSTINHVRSEPPAWPALLCAAIAVGGGWLAGYGWFTLILLGMGGWIGWTIVQWMDMTTGRLMRIEQKLNDIERDKVGPT